MPMREMDFSERNLANRWLGVKGMWGLLQGETRHFVKRRLESFMRAEVSHRLGCGRYERSGQRRGYRNGCYVRDVNGDGFDDLALPGRSSFGWKLNLYYGGPSVDTMRDLWFGEDSLLAWGYAARGYDFDGNGLDDILAWPTFEQNSLLLFDLGEDSDSLPDLIVSPIFVEGQSPIFGERIVTGDFNGDRATDVATNLRFGVTQNIIGSVHLYWGGSNFDTIPDLIITRPGPFLHIKNYTVEYFSLWAMLMEMLMMTYISLATVVSILLPTSFSEDQTLTIVRISTFLNLIRRCE
jgi:hypothetical protein